MLNGWKNFFPCKPPRRLPLSICIAVLSLAAGAAIAAESRYAVDIPAQPMGNALIQFAVATNISVGGVNPKSCGVRARALHGVYTVDAGLKALLKNSACEAVRVDTASYRLQIRRIAPRAFSSSVVDVSAPMEVVVTANRRPQLLGRAPTSVSVISAGRLGASDGSLTDVAAGVPGMMMTNLGPGRDKILLRGVSDGVFTGRTQSTVGLYLDDAPITYNAPDPDLLLLDMARVEVLKGPQGALYGEGSISGVVHLITNLPDLSRANGNLSAGLALTEGGESSSRISAVVNLPIITDKVGLRLVAYRDQSGGYLHYTNDPEYKGNGTVRDGARVAISWKINDNWSLTGNLARQDIETKDSQYIYGGQKDYIRAPGIAEPHDNDFSETAVRLTGETAVGAVKITLNHLHHDISSRYDADPLSAVVAAPNSGQLVYDEIQNVELTTMEGLVTSPTERPLRWLAGVFASDGTENFNPRLIDYKTRAAIFQEDRKDHITNLAAFGELSFDLSAKWILTAGLRLAQSEHTVVSDSRETGNPQDSLSSFRGRKHDMHVAHKLVLTYVPDSRLLFYLQASNGYRSGGFNTTALFEGPAPVARYDGDRLDSYELGAKLTLLDHRLRLTVDGYAIRWNKLQSDQLQATGLPVTVNIGDGLVHGLEFEADWRLLDALDFHAAALFAAPELKHANPLYSIDDDRGMPYIPRQIYSISANWHAQVYAHPLDIMTTFAYRGESHLNFGSLQTVRMGGYGLMDLDAAYHVGAMTYGLRITNLTAARGNSFAYGNPFKIAAGNQVTPLRPRTAWLTVSRDF